MMMKASIAIAILTFCALVDAAPSPFVLKDSINVPSHWVRKPSSSVMKRDEDTVTLHLGLKKRDQAGLEARLLQISDPNHPDYGKWLTADQAREYSRPSDETHQAVARWLSRYTAVHNVKRNGNATYSNSMTVHVPISTAEKMLNTQFDLFEDEETGEQKFTTSHYSLPREVFPHIETIFNLANFARGSAYRKTISNSADGEDSFEYKFFDQDEIPAVSSKKKPASCDPKLVTADCLRDFYGMDSYEASGKGQYIGVAGYLEQYANREDLAMYLDDQRPDAAGYSFKVKSLKGGLNTQSKPGEEANLDIQTVAGLSYPINTTYYTVGGRQPMFQPDAATPKNTNEPFYTLLDWMYDQDDLPNVLSTSYGDDEQSVSQSYAVTVCDAISLLTTQGITILFASGDYGVGKDGKCFTNDGKKKKTFLPSFPASCPWVTAVGATQGFSSEVAANKKGAGFYSGGGFSYYFGRPDWQREAVVGYLAKLGKKYKGLFDPQVTRAYPDVSAQGSRFKIAVDGEFKAISGTSASTPLWASVVALLNDVRIKQGKSKLGFMNPWLYSMKGDGFNDITNGSAAGCNTTGFPAMKGWDPVTGLGTPQFQKLKKLAISNPKAGNF